jgi:phosphocarrier protein
VLDTTQIKVGQNIVKKTLLILNEKGLHARASAKFVETVENHDASVLVCKDGMDVSGDSIMGLMMLAASLGTSIDIETSGAEAEKLAEALESLVKGLFGEGR